MPDHETPPAISFTAALRDIDIYGAILLDSKGLIVSWNAGAAKLFGYEPGEVLGQYLAFLFTDEDRAAGVPETEMAVALRQNFATDDRWHLRKDKSRIYVNGALCLLKNEQREITGFVKILRDQTDKKQRMEEVEGLNIQLHQAHQELKHRADDLEARVIERTRLLHERNAELESFCYSIAHDLRAPLRTIQGMIAVVIEDYGNEIHPTCRDYLSRISRAGSRLDDLTLDLLQYSRLSREEITLTTVSLGRVVEEVLAFFHETIRKTEADIRVHPPFPDVHAQHTYLVQIIGNFVTNALKFVDEKQKPVIEIWTEVDEQSHRVRLFVKDNGIGIPDEYRDKVFLLFERLHPAGVYEGTGVGLAIAQKAALRINSTIGLTSDSTPGCTFWIDLESAR